MKIIFFLKKEIDLKVFCDFFVFFFFENISEKTGYFNTGLVSYNIIIQPNIKQNW